MDPTPLPLYLDPRLAAYTLAAEARIYRLRDLWRRCSVDGVLQMRPETLARNLKMSPRRLDRLDAFLADLEADGLITRHETGLAWRLQPAPEPEPSLPNRHYSQRPEAVKKRRQRARRAASTPPPEAPPSLQTTPPQQAEPATLPRPPVAIGALLAAPAIVGPLPAASSIVGAPLAAPSEEKSPDLGDNVPRLAAPLESSDSRIHAEIDSIPIASRSLHPKPSNPDNARTSQNIPVPAPAAAGPAPPPADHVPPTPSEMPPDPPTQTDKRPDPRLLQALIALGILPPRAADLIARYGAARCRQALDCLPYWKPRNAPACLEAALKADWPLPPAYLQAQQSLTLLAVVPGGASPPPTVNADILCASAQQTGGAFTRMSAPDLSKEEDRIASQSREPLIALPRAVAPLSCHNAEAPKARHAVPSAAPQAPNAQRPTPGAKRRNAGAKHLNAQPRASVCQFPPPPQLKEILHEGDPERRAEIVRRLAAQIGRPLPNVPADNAAASRAPASNANPTVTPATQVGPGRALQRCG